MKELTEKGLQLFSEIRGEERAVAMRQSIIEGEFGSAMNELAVDFVFGSVWTREGLERKDRSLVTISLLIALRQINELKNHIRIGLTNGLKVKEIEEIIIQSAVYAGFPAAHAATNAIKEVFNDLGLDSKASNM